MKPDNVTGSPMNPQNWNLYSYVRGNPVNFNDSTGHQGEETEANGGDPNANVEAQQQIEEEKTGNKDENTPLKGSEVKVYVVEDVKGELGLVALSVSTEGEEPTWCSSKGYEAAWGEQGVKIE